MCDGRLVNVQNKCNQVMLHGNAPRHISYPVVISADSKSDRSPSVRRTTSMVQKKTHVSIALLLSKSSIPTRSGQRPNSLCAIRQI